MKIKRLFTLNATIKCRFAVSILTICIIALCIISICSISASALTYGDLTYEVSNGEVTITRCDSSATSVDIPSTIDGYPVTSIGYSAFYYCTSLTTITIPDSVTSIGDNAFFGCTNLSSITIPDSVASIGDYAFDCCTSLTSITIPDSVTSIGDWAFYGCDNLSTFTIPDGVTSIGLDAFYNTAYYNNSSNWQDNVLYIGNHLIQAKSDISGAYTIKSNTKTIADYAFTACTSLTSITIPDSVISIGTNAFYGCASLKTITIPDSVISIGDEAFDGCTKLESLYITDLAAYLNCEYASYTSNPMCYASKLYINNELATEITIPSTVTKIPSYAIYGCTSLTSITIPNTVTSIGDYAFNGCSRLSTVYYGGSSADWWHKINIGSGNDRLTNASRSYVKLVTIIDENGDLLSTKRYYYNNYISVSELQRTGYSLHLYTDEQRSNEFNLATPITENLTLYLKYIINRYTYQFVDDDGTVLKAQTVDYGTKIAPPMPPADKGVYTFDYWSSFSEGMTVTKNVTFKAVYKYKAFAITVDGFDISTNATYSKNYIVPPAKKYGFEFVGYYSEPDGKGTKLTNSSGGCLGAYYFDTDITVYPLFNDLLVNKAAISGATSMTVGDKNIKYTVKLGTDKENITFSTLNVKYPKELTISKIEKPAGITEIFQEKDSVSGEFKITEIIVIYSYDSAMPILSPITAFNIYFDVSKTAEAKDISIGFANNCVLMDNSNDYPFVEFFEAKATINPKYPDVVTIEGKDAIDSPTKYSARILPEYAINDVTWSVDDASVASISSEGVLTPIKNGTVTITARSSHTPTACGTKTIAVTAYARVESITTDGVWDKAFDNATREYTIYISGDATEFKITPVSATGIFDINGTTAFSNRTKTISLDSEETVVNITLSRVTGYSDSTFVLRVVKFEGTKTTLSSDKKSLTIKPVNLPSSCKLVVTLYGDDGTLVESQAFANSGNEIVYSATNNFSCAKVMVWESFLTLKPLCKAEIANNN